MKKSPKKILAYLAVGLLLTAVTVGAIPAVVYMMRPEFQLRLEQWVAGAGIWGVGLLFMVQIAQIIVAIIPGEPVEVVAGLMYGTVGGLAICLAGILCGSSLIFYLVRKLGRRRLARTKLYPKLMAYNFLRSEEKLQAMVFLLYFIPGTPKDILVYVCALTTLSMKDFLIVSTLARIPSVITSTMAGASFANGNYLLTILIFAITGIAGLAGIRYHNRRFGSR